MLGIVTANELHIPAGDPVHPTATFLKLLSADTDHSPLGFLVPADVLCTRLLAPQASHEHEMQPSHFSEIPVPQRIPRNWEVV